MLKPEDIALVFKEIPDPVNGQSLALAGRLLRVEQEKDYYAIHLQVPALQAEEKNRLLQLCYERLAAHYPDLSFHIHLSHQAGNGATQQVLPQVKNIIAIGSGKGGVGKSTVSVNLALSLSAAGYRVGLIDADVYGPSIPTMLGLQGQRPKVQELYGKPRLLPLETQGIYVMSIGFIIEPDQAVVLRGPRLSGVLRQFLTDCIWPELDFLLIDLPPGTGDVQLTLVQTVPVTGAVIVTTPQKVAVADALRALNMFRMPNIQVPILGVVENMAWFSPAEYPDHKYYIFGSGGGAELVKESASVLMGQIPLVQSLRESGDEGVPLKQKSDPQVQEAFERIAKSLVSQVVLRNEMLPPTRMVSTESNIS